MSALRARYRQLQLDSRQERPLSYPTLFWLFITGSLLGFVLEGVWHFLHHGTWGFRVATLWGPFCIIYGVGAVVMYLLSLVIERWQGWAQFCMFALAGSAVEYLSSLFQEVCFGTVSWDYSQQAMNLGGRVSLKMAVIWGILGLALMYVLLPLILKGFNRLQLDRRAGACRVMTVFMCVNLLLTSAALMRWEDRMQEKPARNAIEAYLDRVWDDERMQERFPNMRFVDET